MVQKRIKNATKSTKRIRKLMKRIQRLESAIKTIDFKSSLYEDRNNYDHSLLEKRIEFLENETFPF